MTKIAKRKITLNLDSDSIYPYPSMTNSPPFPSSPTWISYATLSDDGVGNNKGKNKGGNSGTFESFVNRGTEVTWDTSQSSSNNSKYKVAIIDIYNSPLPNSPIIFSETTIVVGSSGKVRATVLPTASTSEPGANESYSIYFSITPKPNGTIKYYGFDPKIKVNPLGTD